MTDAGIPGLEAHFETVRFSQGSRLMREGKGLEEFIFTDEPDPAALAAQIAGHADELAAATMTETGIGCVADKVEKNLFGSLGVAKSLVGKPGVCADADVEAAARMVVASKAFDHGLICGSENNLVVDRAVRETFIGALRQAGALPVSRIMVNSPAAQGCIGRGNGLTPSLTLGCGTYGGTSTTDNVTYTNLINVKRIARPLAGIGGPVAV
jgi:hypothetical protein